MIVTQKEGKTKSVIFWLTNAEKNDPALRASLKPQFAHWRAKGYLPVVMESGEGDLELSMRYLMKDHLVRSARAEIAAEKERQDRVSIRVSP